MLPFKTAEKLIFSPVKIDRILVPHCYSHNRAHQASVVLLPLELFSIQAHVISRDLHFFEGNNFHESVFKALCQKAATIQNSLLFIWFLSNGFLMDFFFWRGGGLRDWANRVSKMSVILRLDSCQWEMLCLCTRITPCILFGLWYFMSDLLAEALHTIH